MRLLHRIGLAGLVAAMIAAPIAGQKPDDQILPRSVELLREGEALLAATA